MEDSRPRIAVIGAGWAGAVAAAALTDRGLPPVVFEAATIAGGRARRVEKDGRAFDNGQHLLVGAYERTLPWIDRFAGAGAYLRLPLTVRTAAGLQPALDLQAWRGAPAPLPVAGALLAAHSLPLADRMRGLLRLSLLLRRRPAHDVVVDDWLSCMPASIRQHLLEPLCVGALNTDVRAASARVFFEVLQRTFNRRSADADFVIPRCDLSRLLPEPALAYVQANGGSIHLGTPVLSVRRAGTDAQPAIAIETKAGREVFDAVVVAVASQHLPRLLAGLPEAERLTAALATLRHEAIATVHFDLPFLSGVCPDSDPVRLLDGSPGQWVFMHRLASGGIRLSIVVSAVPASLLAAGHAALARAVRLQLARSFDLPEPLWEQVIVEKRATHACTPGQVTLLSSLPSALLPELPVAWAGDWTEPDLPATLEAAVRSAERAADAIARDFSLR